MATPRTSLRRALRFDRSDRWFTSMVLVLVPIGVLWAQVVHPLVLWAQGDPIAVTVTDQRVTVPALDAVGVAYGRADVVATIADPTTGQRWLHLLPGVVVVLLAVAVCWQLRRLAQAITSGDPFRPGGWRRLITLAFLLGLGWPVAEAVRQNATMEILTAFRDPALGMSAELTFFWPALAIAGVLGLLAEAFASGQRLREDVEGLV